MLLIFPVFFGFYFSLFKVNFLQIERFTWFQNFGRILGRPETLPAIGRSLFLSLTAAALSILAGFILAYWADKRSGGYSYFIQILGLVPWVTSMVVGALLWKWIFAGDLGLYNYVRSLVGLSKVQPLQYAGSAMGSLIFVVAWRTVGYSMVMILAGLKTVPIELIEASRVDGANLPQRLLYIIIPSIRTSVLVAMIVVTLSNMNNVTVPMVLTGGGPAEATNVASLELYRMGFLYNDFGGASALALVMFGINVLLIVVYMRMVKWNV